jgi:hypothetical protein
MNSWNQDSCRRDFWSCISVSICIVSLHSCKERITKYIFYIVRKCRYSVRVSDCSIVHQHPYNNILTKFRVTSSKLSLISINKLEVKKNISHSSHVIVINSTKYYTTVHHQDHITIPNIIRTLKQVTLLSLLYRKFVHPTNYYYKT